MENEFVAKFFQDIDDVLLQIFHATSMVGNSKHFRERVWVEVCHRAGVRQNIC